MHYTALTSTRIISSLQYFMGFNRLFFIFLLLNVVNETQNVFDQERNSSVSLFICITFLFEFTLLLTPTAKYHQ